MVAFSQSMPHRSRVPKSHHESHSRRSARREAPSQAQPEKRVEVELVDLDDLRDPIKIGIRKTSRLSHITAFLKHRYCDDDEDEPISEDAQIAYYWMDKCLLGDEIPSGISILHYRAYDCDGAKDGIQVIWSNKLHIEEDRLEEIQDAIDKGENIGGLRRIFASLLDIKDSNRIVISARGGLRPGLLQGNNWEIKKIKAWLCRKIWIDIAPPSNYIILLGVNEEYIYHPPLIDDDYTVDFRTLRNWLLSRIITNAHYRSSSRLKVDSDDITLICNGKMLSKRGRVSFGQPVDFELTRAVADKFIAEESWLVPETESCTVCGDDKRVSEMPTRITRSCEHDPTTCKECISQWITSSMDTLAWDRLKCPECPQLLCYDDVKAFASQETFERYDTLAMKSAVTNIRDFKWCLNSRCNSGQIVRPGCDRLRCHSCKALSCAQHNLPWHRGETCEEFDRRTRKQRRSERASERKVKEITKPCPECQKDVHKFSGCDHITCVCGHEWCYICLETYYRDRNSFLQCKHKKDCKYFENPPNYEGGRAFLPFLNQMNEANRNRQDWRIPHPHRMRPQPPRLGVWPPRPNPPNHNPFQPAPAPHPRPAADGAQPAQDQPVANPFQFLMEDFLGLENNVQFHINHVRHEELDNEFLGRAALFTMEHLMQRAR